MENMWHGYPCEKLEFEEHEALIVYPEEGMSNGYLAVKTEYWGAFPEAIETCLLAKGFHLALLKMITDGALMRIWTVKPDLSGMYRPSAD